MNFLYCHEDNEVAQAVGARMAGAFSSCRCPGALGQGNLCWPVLCERGAAGPDSGLAMHQEQCGKVPEGVTAGDPGHITDTIKMWESIGVDRINFLVQTPVGIPQPDVMKSLELFTREVLPQFA